MQQSIGDGDAARVVDTASVADEQAPPIAVQLCDLSKLRDALPHERPRHVRNEALNTLIEFGHFFAGVKRYRRGPPPGYSMTHLLRDVSLEVPVGCVVGVVDLGGASRNALLKIIAGMSAPHKGKLLRRGSVIGIRQLLALAAPDRTCRENLLLLSNLFGIDKSRVTDVLAEVGTISGLQEALDRPLRRCAKGEFLDLAISFVCLLNFDIVVTDEINQTVSEQVSDQWYEYISSAPARGQTLFISSRRLSTVFDLATHLLLLEKGRLRAFGPTPAVLIQHEDFIEEALVAPFQDVGESERIDDDEEGGEEDDLGLVDDDIPLADETWRRPGPRTAIEDQSASALEVPPVEFAYITRESALCEILYEADNMVLYPDGGVIVQASNSNPIAAITQQLPVLFREDGLLVRLALRVPARNVVLRPGIDLMRSKKIPALRLIAPEDLKVQGPCKLTADIKVPPHLLEKIPYTLSSFVACFEEGQSEPEFAITKNYATFIVTSREDAAASALSSANRKGPFPMLRISRELEIRKAKAESVLRLDEGWRMQPPDAPQEGAQVPTPQSDGSVPRCLAVGQVLVEDELELSGWVDFRAERSIALRCEIDPPVKLGPGLHELSMTVPSEVLPPREYALEVTLRESTGTGNSAETCGKRQWSFENPADAPKDRSLSVLDALPAARATMNIAWSIHVEREGELKEAGNDR